MFDDDEGPKDWEIKDEEPPEALKRKWERDETLGLPPVVCPSCKKETPAGNLTCIFCGTDLIKIKGDQCRPNYHYEKEVKSLGGTVLSQGSCPVSCLFSWVKRLFKKG